MTLRMGLPPEAQGLKILGEDGIWTPALGTQQLENFFPNPSFEGVQPGSTVLRTNYARDPLAEYSITHFNGIGAGQAPGLREIATDRFKSGNTSWKVTASAAGQIGNKAMVPNNSLLIRKGEVFVWSFWVYSTVADEDVPVYWEGTKAVDNSYVGGLSGKTSIPANEWTKVTGWYNPTLDIYLGGAGCYNIDVQAGDQIWMDEFLIEKTDTLGDFFYGGSDDTLGWNYEWAGTPGSSVSTAKAAAVELRRNLVLNPSFELPNGIIEIHKNRTPGLGSWTLSGDATYSNGEVSLNASGAYVESPMIPVNTVGDTYGEFLLDYFTSTAATSFTTDGGFHFNSYYFDANGVAIANSLGNTSNDRAAAVPVNQWIYRDYNATTKWLVALGPGIAFVKFRIMLSTYASPVVKIRRPTFTSGPSSAATDLNRFDYYDGSTPASGDFHYVWLGTTGSAESAKRADAFNTTWGAARGKLFRSTVTSPHSGIYTARYMGEGISGGNYVHNSPSKWSVVAGKSYTLSTYARRGPTAVNWLARLYWYDSGNVLLGSSTPTVFTAVGTDWTRLSHTATAPTGAVTAMCYFLAEGTVPAGVDTWFDSVVFENSSVLGGYIDGSSFNSGDYTYAWTGVAHDSPSVRYGKAINGSLRVGGLLKGAIQSSNWQSSGKFSARLIPNGTSISPESYISDSLSTSELKPGGTYTALATVRLTAPLTGTLRSESRAIQVRGNSGSVIAQSASAPNLAGVYPLRLTFTIPTKTTSPNIRLYHGGTEGSGDVWWDNFAIIEGTYTGPYFNGDSAPDVDYVYRWSGLPHASSSIGI